MCKLKTWEEPVVHRGFCVIVFSLSFFSAIEKKKTTRRYFDLQDHSRQCVFEKVKQKNPLLNKINCKQTQGNPLKGPVKRFTLPCGK